MYTNQSTYPLEGSINAMLRFNSWTTSIMDHLSLVWYCGGKIYTRSDLNLASQATTSRQAAILKLCVSHLPFLLAMPNMTVLTLYIRETF